MYNKRCGPFGRKKLIYKCIESFKTIKKIIVCSSIISQLFCSQVWFQNRRAKFRKQERLAQQKSSQSSSSSTVDATSIKTEPKQCGQSKDGKPGTPSTPGSISSNNGSTDMKSVNGTGKYENKKIMINV